MKLHICSNRGRFSLAALTHALLCFVAIGPVTVLAEPAADYVSIPPLINTDSSGDKPNVLFILDNSNSMDEAPTGQAVGSANAGSKSEIARNAIKEIISNFSASSRMGLMAYQQSGVGARRLHDSQYDASYDPANYDPAFTGSRDSLTKKFRVPNPADPGGYIHYNVALPFYAGSNYGSAFCYSTTADFDNGSETTSGPWDSYSCYTSKTGTSDGNSGFSNYWFGSAFFPTDSDYAQNILDFGTNLTWQYVSETWFSNSSPGRGYLHVEIDDVDAGQLAALNAKLATSQFSSSTDTPLRNAGLTPIEGSLDSALRYFQGSLPSSQSVTSGSPSAPPTNSCAQQDYVILVTDGLPSVNASGTSLTDTAAAVAAAANEAADLLAQGIRTYVIGFALPNGVDVSLLDTIAAAGGTTTTYLANDSETLLDSLATIFLSFSNRNASSSSAAVLANNSRGEGAIFQAIYNPVKEDNLGNEVNWVGNLYGFFLDEQGLLREDTNQNDQLDDYTTDRVFQYFVNLSDSTTRAHLYVGSSATTPPDLASATPVATVDADQLNTIWDAKDPLADLSDVLTQRTYTDSAANGRYILSSVDGVNALEFVQTSDAEIAALVATQTAAQDAVDAVEPDFNVAQSQYLASSTASAQLEGQMNDAFSDWEDEQEDLSDAQDALSVAQDSLSEAESDLVDESDEYEVAATDFDGNNAARFISVGTGGNAYRDSVTDVLTLSSGDEFTLAVDAVIGAGGDTADPDVIAALATLTAVENDSAAELAALITAYNNFSSAMISSGGQLNTLFTGLTVNGSLEASEIATINTLRSDLDALGAALAIADANYNSGDVYAARSNYYDALIDTGVNPNPGPVRGPREDYEAAQLLEIDAESATVVALGLYESDYSDYVQPLDSFLAEYYDVQVAVVARASAESNVLSAQQDVTDAEDAEDAAEQLYNESVSAHQGGLDLLAPVEASFLAIESVYNAAVAAYNLATQTVNNSNTLINYLDVSTVEEAYNVVKFIRGEEGITGYRSRTIDIDGDGTTEVWRLGDIVHSSPALVGAPRDNYDSLYIDRTYAAFRDQYKDRRQVMYVGANDGMLHAFNAGFWDVSTKSFSTSNSFSGGSAVEHPLGAELWSYVPRAALPHLQWLTDPNYAHNYYVDGDPVTFDANIFPSDAAHPNGWGTVLMIGMRFGGGAIAVDSDADGTDDVTLTSSYMLFDVTDPEQAPTFMAEISDPGLGFTTSIPKVIKRRIPGSDFSNPSANEWYVVFGSGPTELDDGSSTQGANLYVYDLAAGSFLSGFGPLDLGAANSFVGDMSVFDHEGDFVDDTLYFGVNSGTPATGSNGVLMRARLDQSAGSAVSTLFNAGEPVVSEPNISTDQFGRRWVTFGTGRLFMSADNITVDAQNFYGIMEPVDSSGGFTWNAVSSGSVLNSTNIEVRDSGAISTGGSTVQIDGEDIDNFDELVGAVRENRSGWLRALNTGGVPAERNVSRATAIDNTLLFTAYTPSTNSCSPLGTSRLFGVDIRTGTAQPFEVFAPDDDPDTVENDIAAVSVDLGIGLASRPTVIRNSSSGGFTVITSGTKGGIGIGLTAGQTASLRQGRQSWRQIFLD